MQKALLDEMFSRLPEGAITVQYWDGTNKQYGEGNSLFAIHLMRPLSGLKAAKDPVLALGEAYMDGVIEVDGDLTEVIRWAFSNQNMLPASPSGKLARRVLAKINKPASLAQQKKDVQFHYDLGNDFYALWLDETMSYSCAYFHSPEDTLTQAQLQKIDHTLKKLELKPGETLLDIGSGWGWLIIRAAQEYGIKAMGITLSEEQLKETKRRIAELDLQDKVEVELMDYRVLAESGRTFDKIVSVGMFEHVGQANYPQFMLTLKKLLKEGGLTLLHTITHTKGGPVNSWIEKYIFPGGYIPSLREVIWLLPDYDFHVIDLESLRMHYAMTLDRWAEGFEKHVDEVREMYGDRFVRMWRLYLRSCAASFQVSGLNVHQILFSRGLKNNLPLTRRHLYT